MACATLKRPLVLDPLSNPSPKRRRLFFRPVEEHEDKEKAPSPFAEGTPKLNMDNISFSIRQEMKRIHHRRRGMSPQHPFWSPSATATVGGGPMMSMSPLSSPRFAASSSSPSSSPLASLVNNNSNNNALTTTERDKDKPLFTFRQIGMICERLLKEREETLQEEYDKILNVKLAEQYDTFVKFTHDQIQKQFEKSAAPSYLS